MTDPAASPLRIVLPGPPASGKGTRGRRLAARLDLGNPVCPTPVVFGSSDSEDNFIKRQREFQRLTQPVLAHYRDPSLLVPGDATAPRDEVAQDLLSHFILRADV